MMSGLQISHQHVLSVESAFLRNHRPCFFYSTVPPPYKAPQSLLRNPNSPFRLQTIVKAVSHENPSTPIEAPVPESDAPISSNRVEIPDSVSGSGSSLFSSLSLIRSSLCEVLKLDELGREILSIALPAALALAADPITSLVDTAFVGHLGSVELAAVGVSASVFNFVSKLFNVPLLNITTSFVAEEQTLVTRGDDESIHIDQNCRGDLQHKKFLPSVSTSLALAATIGVAEALALSVGSGFLMNTMGIPFDSPVRIPAEQFITLRAFGAPPIVIALAAQGTFRGFKDTKTPLYAVGAGNLLNVILDTIFIFLIGLGIDGAALATVISEYLIAFILLWKLNDKVLLISPNFEGTKIIQYLKSGGFLIGRTLAVLVTVTLATSMVAREGPISIAGYQICLEVWLALSLLTDALALAGQVFLVLSRENLLNKSHNWYKKGKCVVGVSKTGTVLLASCMSLLASSYSQGNYDQARQVIYRVLQLGITAGVSLTVILFLGFGAICSLFSNDSEVLETARSGTLFVAGSQTMNALAFVLDGLYYGVSDFEYTAYSMILIGMISSLFILAAAPVFGLAGVWTGLYLFMALRVVAGIWRLSTRSGPWKSIWSKKEQE